MSTPRKAPQKDCQDFLELLQTVDWVFVSLDISAIKHVQGHTDLFLRGIEFTRIDKPGLTIGKVSPLQWEPPNNTHIFSASFVVWLVAW